MKVTSNLCEYIASRMQNEKLYFSNLAERSGLTWQTWDRVVNGKTLEIKDSTIAKMAQALGVAPDDLIDINKGVRRNSNAKHDETSRRAESLYRWLGHDKRRCDMVRAMGYEGVLPK